MGNRLYFKKGFCITQGSLRGLVFHDNHESRIDGSGAFQKTLQLLRRYYYWHTIKIYAKKCIGSFHKYHEAKSDTQGKNGYHRPFPQQELFDGIKYATKITNSSMESSNVSNSDNLNEHRRIVFYAIGCNVLLSTKNLTLKKGSIKKFSPKFIGHFKILDKRANVAAYKLGMPSMYAQPHMGWGDMKTGCASCFHVSLRKKCTADENRRYSLTPSSYETSCGTTRPPFYVPRYTYDNTNTRPTRPHVYNER